MLSQQTIDVIKSTIPLLEEHGEAITTSFYSRMFQAHPYLKNIFNQTNQATGDQPRSLRDSVVAYAQNIDNLEALTPAVQRIAHKHTSLNIQPKHYPIVGENLLLAIADVLDLPEDHIALKAWGEAYQALAEILINVEEEVYQQSAWRGFKEFYIAKVEDETPEIKSLYLQPLDKTDLPTFKAGQFIGLQVRPDDSRYYQIRQYSITGSDENGLRISVKREEDGSVSNYLHNASVGEAISLLPPFGVFTLEQNDKKKVFIAGGVGITPLFSMLNEAVDKLSASDILFIQATKNEEYEVFKDEIATLQDKHGFSYKRNFDEASDDSNSNNTKHNAEHTGRLDLPTLEQWLAEGGFNADNSEVYFCGSKPFMHAMNEHCKALGFGSDSIHFEVFGPTVEI